MIRRWPKVFTIGDRHTERLFYGPVSISEKVDGSQLNVAKCSAQGLTFLTKGSTTYLNDGNKLFQPAVRHFHSVEDRLQTDWTYHGETLCSPRHNTLKYGRVPLNHFALYGVSLPDGSQVSSHEELKRIAVELDVDVAPEIFSGVVDKVTDEFLTGLLNRVSYLGEEHIEGFVVKRYDEEIIVGGQVLPLIQGKFVSSQFKERHKVAWPTNNKSPLVAIGEMVRTKARWEKVIQRLKDNGEFEQHPRDIGKCLKYLHKDIDEEDKEEIKEALYKAFSKDLKRAATRNFPEAYKMWLATGELRMDLSTPPGEDQN